MTEPLLWLRDVEDRAAGKPVLLVEGDDDVMLLGHYLTQHAPGWETRLVLLPAQGKQRVVSGVCVHRPDWIGVIDLDEWNPDDLAKAATRSSRLLILPRFCIESFFCHPDEIWKAIPLTQRQRVGDDPEVLRQPILAALPDWVAHGAMWRVLRRLYHAARLPAELEQAPITDEAEIRRILETWHKSLAPDLVMQQYRGELAVARQLGPNEQIQRYVHGKKFYNQVVVQILDGLFSGKGADDWLQKFQDAKIQPPPDLQGILDQILHLVSATV
jgi:hypothetical protein